MANPTQVVDQFNTGYLQGYGTGIDSTNGINNKHFFYDAAGIKAASIKPIFRQFASIRNMPQKSGKEYRVKVFHSSYQRNPYDDASMETIGGIKVFNDDFAKYGYITNRSLSEVSGDLWGKDPRLAVVSSKDPDSTLTREYTNYDGTALNPTLSNQQWNDNGRRLLEGEGRTNFFTMKATTLSTTLEKFGEMIEFTEDLTLFSEDNWQLHFHEELGERSGYLYEDLIQIDMLGTPNVFFSGSATSLATMGNGIGAGTPDTVTGKNEVEESFKINYELIQKVVQRLVRYGAKKKTRMITGSINIDTKVVPECYYAICGDAVKYDLEQCVRGTTYEKSYCFTPVEQYAAAAKGQLAEGEFGRMGDVRFILADKMLVEAGAGAAVDAGYVGSLSNTNGKFDVFPVLFPCEDSFSVISLSGKDGVKFFSHAPSSDLQDPYAERAYFAYKFWYGSIITRPEHLLRLNVLASA